MRRRGRTIELRTFSLLKVQLGVCAGIPLVYLRESCMTFWGPDVGLLMFYGSHTEKYHVHGDRSCRCYRPCNGLDDLVCHARHGNQRPGG